MQNKALFGGKMTKRKEDNLIPQAHTLTLDEQSAGGKASGDARRRKKTMRELAVIVNSLPLSENNKKQLPAGIKEDEMTFQMAFIVKVYKKALEGDAKAMKLWVELSNTLDEKKTELEIKKLKAEIKKLNNEGQSSSNVEDLTPLANMLKGDNEDDD